MDKKPFYADFIENSQKRKNATSKLKQDKRAGKHREEKELPKNQGVEKKNKRVEKLYLKKSEIVDTSEFFRKNNEIDKILEELE